MSDRNDDLTGPGESAEARASSSTSGAVPDAVRPTEPNDSPEGAVAPDAEQPTFREAFAALAKNAGMAAVTPGEMPTAASLVRAVGGVRGLVEAILPGLGFLIIYASTKSLPAAVLVPVGIAVLFVVARLVARTSPTQALAGVAGVAISAGLALFTGRAEDNFLAGIIINSVFLLLLLVSLLVRYPLIGVLVGLITNEFLAWRSNVAKRRILTVATWLWCGLFSVRLLVEVPLYLTRQVELLGAVKLILGVPFYAGVLWITWLLVRTVYARPEGTEPIR